MFRFIVQINELNSWPSIVSSVECRHKSTVFIKLNSNCRAAAFNIWIERICECDVWCMVFVCIAIYTMFCLMFKDFRSFIKQKAKERNSNIHWHSQSPCNNNFFIFRFAKCTAWSSIQMKCFFFKCSKNENNDKYNENRFNHSFSLFI